jgi:hypothetical protein
MDARHFLTLRVDNLPETGKRQYENKQDSNLTRRHGVDCTTIRHEKICAVIFPPNETRHALRCGATSEELIELSEVAGSERIAGSSYRACCCFTAKGRPAQPRPRSVRARMYGSASCRCRFSERRTSFQSVVGAPPKNYLCFPATGFAFPDLRSQHRPVQPDAIGLQTENGDRTIISTSAVTSASCADTSVSIRKTRLTERKSSQALAEWICATHKSTASASGTGENGCCPKTRLGSRLAAAISAVFRLKYSARQLSDGDNSSSGTFSLFVRLQLRSRSLPQRSYSLNAALASSPFNLAISPRTWLLSSAFAGQGRIAAHQHPGGGIGRQAIEIRIAQDGDPLFGFLQQACLDGFDVLARHILRGRSSNCDPRSIPRSPRSRGCDWEADPACPGSRCSASRPRR